MHGNGQPIRTQFCKSQTTAHAHLLGFTPRHNLLNKQEAQPPKHSPRKFPNALSPLVWWGFPSPEVFLPLPDHRQSTSSLCSLVVLSQGSKLSFCFQDERAGERLCLLAFGRAAVQSPSTAFPPATDDDRAAVTLTEDIDRNLPVGHE